MPVKDEDIDWLVYHALSSGGPKTEEELVQETGLASHDVTASLVRLKSNFLIDCRESSYDILSIPEMLFRCQCRYSQETPVFIEDGVVKVKKPEQ